MPFEDEEMESVVRNGVEFANRKINDKLSAIASVDNLIELRNDFEKRIRSYFKSI